MSLIVQMFHSILHPVNTLLSWFQLQRFDLNNKELFLLQNNFLLFVCFLTYRIILMVVLANTLTCHMEGPSSALVFLLFQNIHEPDEVQTFS